MTSSGAAGFEPLLTSDVQNPVSLAIPPRSMDSTVESDSDDDSDGEDMNESSFSGSFVMLVLTLWMLFTELMVIVEVYHPTSGKFFAAGIVLFVVPFVFGSVFAGGCASTLGLHAYTFRIKQLDYVPVISCLSLTTPICFRNGTDMAYFLSVILSLLSTFPLFYLDLIFLLNYGDTIIYSDKMHIVHWGNFKAPFWSALHLSSAFFMLCGKPLVCYALERFERTKSRFEPGETHALPEGKVRTIGNVIDSYVLVFGPALSLEVIYIFPILFEHVYFKMSHLSNGVFIALMVVFNVPKLFFIGFALRECHGTEGLLYGPFYLFYPAVPWISTLVSKQKKDGTDGAMVKYVMLFAYLILSYVVCGLILLFAVGTNAIAGVTLVLVVYQIVCVLVIVPLGLYFGVEKLIAMDHEF